MKERPFLDPENLDENRMYGTDFIASMLDVQVATVRLWIRQGKLPAVKIGRNHKVRRADLLAFLNSTYHLE